MTAELILAIAVGGAAGAMSRWAAGRFVARHTVWPGWTGTLAVNLAGCLVIGLLAGLPDLPTALLAAGLCGAMTSFSSFALDLAILLWEGRPRQAMLATGISVLGGGLLTWTGLIMSGAA